ncbi:MAG: pilus assembly protein PilM [Actinomycetota bacterium]|nr:pilus assembly protein PilM [Actinomycetota bacterium]
MALLTTAKPKSVVGLDIEAGSIAATEVRSNGSVEVVGHGVMALAPGIFREGEVADADALGAAIKELFSQRKLSRGVVRLGIANQRVAVRSMRLPAIEDRDELETAIRFQAQDHIPMPLDQSVLDWQVVGHSQSEGGDRRVEVVAVAARRDMLQQVMRALSVGGVRPIGIDHSAFGMIRALARETGTPVGAAQFVSAPSYEQRSDPAAGATSGTVETHIPARLYCNLGDVTNLAVARGSSCLFTRIAAFGVEGIAQKLAERRQLTLEHARGWLIHVGLEEPVEAIEGDREHVAAARECLADGSARLADELRLSLDYYGAQEEAVQVEGIVACGPGAMIPGLVDRLQQSLGHQFMVARPAPLSHLEEGSAARLTLSYGLALEG